MIALCNMFKLVMLYSCTVTQLFWSLLKLRVMSLFMAVVWFLLDEREENFECPLHCEM